MFISFLLYLIIIILTSVLAEVSVRVKEKILRYIIVFITLLIPSFFAGIRYDVGTDYFAYVNIFSNLEAGGSSRTEFGYQFLNILVANLGGNASFLLFVVSFITILFIYLSLYRAKDSISIGLGMLVFMLMFYHLSLNAVRQVLAIAILLYSFDFIIQRKFGKFLIITLIASSIHLSSLIVLPFYYIYNLVGKKNRFFRLIVYIGTSLLIINYGVILEYTLSIFTSFSYYSQYLPDENQGDLGIGLILVNAPFVVPGIIFYKRFVKYDSRFKFYFFFLLIGVIIQFVAYLGAGLFDRISDLFFITVVLIVPYYYKCLKKNEFEYSLSIIIVLFVVFIWFYSYIYLGNNETIPFRSIFSL
ncbi:EpsG family protein [Salimicrobium salexigens]|uniref:EpsG family protein n=1 Tax=Salimicrobium salexigens TaxID=908941 RepID=A0ABY1KVC0_9BACI|nr:EpsG family protein [Salimicrobium salexigens]